MSCTFGLDASVSVPLAAPNENVGFAGAAASLELDDGTKLMLANGLGFAALALLLLVFAAPNGVGALVDIGG